MSARYSFTHKGRNSRLGATSNSAVSTSRPSHRRYRCRTQGRVASRMRSRHPAAFNGARDIASKRPIVQMERHNLFSHAIASGVSAVVIWNGSMVLASNAEAYRGGAEEGSSGPGRSSIHELAGKTGRSEEEQVAIEAAKSLMAVLKIKKDGQEINNLSLRYFGSAFVIGNGCYAITARHVVNLLRWQIENEKTALMPSIERPTGYEITMQRGFAPDQATEVIQGTVLFSGSSAMSADHDIALIRLSRKSAAEPTKVAAASDAELEGAKLISIGIPGDFQAESRPLAAYADANCRGLKSDDLERRQQLGGFPISCLTGTGDSGGMILANVNVNGRHVWRAVGTIAQHQTAPVPSGEKSRFTSFAPYRAALTDIMKDDTAKHPCR